MLTKKIQTPLSWKRVSYLPFSWKCLVKNGSTDFINDSWSAVRGWETGRDEKERAYVCSSSVSGNLSMAGLQMLVDNAVKKGFFTRLNLSALSNLKACTGMPSRLDEMLVFIFFGIWWDKLIFVCFTSLSRNRYRFLTHTLKGTRTKRFVCFVLCLFKNDYNRWWFYCVKRFSLNWLFEKLTITPTHLIPQTYYGNNAPF